ncbi:DUF4214 domain-containing protein [Marivita hallyeonensis]|uniref:Phospholipase/lecithinase/hemolysin n=1 Tax=Marivita hallyeonensis TaxID=996342 RepID=A0A1M5QPY8_9RHOB|nr:DUF4214 domain-containing protein [Marivita hallyeonensis]SHH15810.1 Phospholipase/lecithinase/hemolysin [Marivita hallyeonensis]
MTRTGELYVFGDSLSDDGATAVQLQDEPIDLFFAGRASNGLVWHEYIRNDLAVAPAAASISQAPDEQGFLGGSELNGINFAHGGAVSSSDEDPTLPGAVQQAQGFANLVAAGEIEAPNDQDVFAIWIGGNDFLQVADASNFDILKLFSLDSSIVDNIETAVDTLIAVGARNFLLLGQPTIGGAFLGNEAPSGSLLARFWNGRADDFNDALSDYADDVDAVVGQSALYIDIASLVDDIEDDPASFGFSNVSSDIFADDAPLDDQTYFSVDGIHPTGAGHKVIADFVVGAAKAAGFDLTAQAGNELPGSSRDDIFEGTEGPDTIIGNAGDDLLQGDGNTDTAVYAGAQNLFTLSLSDGITLTDRSGAEGVDTLLDIETLQFRDSSFDVSRFDDGGALGFESLTNLVEMYISYFNRAPDAVGLTFWADAFANGTPLTEIAELFATSPEGLAVFPADLPAQQLVTTVYENTLGRAPDDAGRAFWTGALESGAVDRGQFVLAVLEGTRFTPSDATEDFISQQETDQDFLISKALIGRYFAAELGMSNVENAATVMALFDGTSDGIAASLNAADGFFDLATAADGSGEFLLQIVGTQSDVTFL